jgi:hypothetical protein
MSVFIILKVAAKQVTFTSVLPSLVFYSAKNETSYAMYVQHNIVAHPVTIVVMQKQQCILSLFHIVINGTIFREKMLNIKCVLIFFKILPKIFLILRRIQADIIINLHTSSCKVPVILVRFYINLNFPRQIFGQSSNTKFHENPPSGSQSVPCGRTDMTKLTVAFRNFANATPKNENNCDSAVAFMYRLICRQMAGPSVI